MDTENSIIIAAPAARIYEFAAPIERWPEILPHYRWVTILREEQGGRWRLAEMAAHRDGFPVKWVSIQELDPATHGIRYHHVRGVTRGMDVEWTFEDVPQGAGTLVRIVHRFDPPWPPLVGPLVARHVVGDLFVHDIANRTLRRIKDLCEAPGTVGAAEMPVTAEDDGQHGATLPSGSANGTVPLAQQAGAR